MLFTTYLANLKGIDLENQGLKNPHVYYVMRNRGNNAVAPRKNLLDLAKSGKLDWDGYRRGYLKDLRCVVNPEPYAWMRRVAEESVWRDVVLVCFEKDHNRCHRTLLALEMERLFPEVNFVGELLINRGKS